MGFKLTTLITVTALTCGSSPAWAQTAIDSLQPLVQSSARRLALGRQVAFAKWDSHSGVTDAAREERVISSAIKEGESYGLDRATVADFFRAQIEANKLVQSSLLGEWHRAGEAPAHKPIDLSSVVRPQIDQLQTELIKELAKTSDLRVDSACPEYVAKAIGKYLEGLKNDPCTPEKMELDRALAATCTRK